MADISGFGLRAFLVASATFPQGIELTAFADDSDPLDFPVQTVAETAMGLNGDLLTWSSANPIMAALALIPDSADDRNMSILLEANRPARGKVPARDVLTLTVIYPSGKQTTCRLGSIISGPPSLGVASAGRLKTRIYQTAFEDKSES